VEGVREDSAREATTDRGGYQEMGDGDSRLNAYTDVAKARDLVLHIHCEVTIEVKLEAGRDFVGVDAVGDDVVGDVVVAGA